MAESKNRGFVQLAIPKFNKHYDHWAMLMDNFLRSKKYWDLIENGISVVVTQGTGTRSDSTVVAIEAQCKSIEDQAKA
jgi:accessory colonization factor AcfC